MSGVRWPGQATSRRQVWPAQTRSSVGAVLLRGGDVVTHVLYGFEPPDTTSVALWGFEPPNTTTTVVYGGSPP